MLRNFIRDRGTQITLGTFVATFVYAVLALGSVSHGPRGDFVPHLSITVALAPGARGPRRAHLLHPSRRDVDPAPAGHGRHRAGPVAWPIDAEVADRRCGPAVATSPGSSEAELLARMRGARRRACAAPTSRLSPVRGVLDARRHRGAGGRGHPAAAPARALRRGGPPIGPGLACRSRADGGRGPSNGAHATGAHRTLSQDLAFAIDQLVEIAIRALSPAVNDTFTALTCIDWLGDGLCKISGRWNPRRAHRDAQGYVRVIAAEPSYERLVDRSFDKIRQAGRGMPAVLIRQLEAFAKVMEYTHDGRAASGPAASGRHDPAVERRERARARRPRRRQTTLRRAGRDVVEARDGTRPRASHVTIAGTPGGPL